jgi:DNA-binding Lrp family transcriptional regulator
MRGYILIHVRAGEERQLIGVLKGQPGVLRADVTFGPYDAIVEVEAPDLAGVGKVVYNTIRVQPGVIDTLTCLAVE